jgi:hypothetical protein
MNGECELATRKKIQACYWDSYLLIVAEGDLPTPCYEVSIERNLLTVDPPEYVLKRCPTAGFCQEVETPYTATKLFPVDTRPAQVIVHHAKGRDTVEVKDEDAESPMRALLSTSGESDGVQEAVGRSRNLSFDEAFADAIKKLPRPNRTKTDYLDVIKVTEIRGEFGGFAGLHDLVVKVQRLTQRR